MIIDGYDYISEREFDEVWGARGEPNGDLYFLDEIRSYPVEHIWTVSEGEDVERSELSAHRNWYAAPGIHFVNALGYVITSKAWRSNTRDAIWYLDDDDQAHEDRERELSAQAPLGTVE
jgi:hypothetical protein